MPCLNIQQRVGLLLHCTPLYLVTLHIIYIEVLFTTSTLDSGHSSVLSSSELSPPQVTDAVWPGLLAPVVPHFRAVQHLFMMCGVPHQTQHLTVYFILDPLKQIVVIKFRNTFRALLAPSRKIPGHWCLIWSRRYLKSDLLGLIWSHTSYKTAAPQQWSNGEHPPTQVVHPTVAQCVSLFMLYEMETVVLSHLII